MNAESDDNNDNMKRAKEAIEKYYFQLTEGCGRSNCTNVNCASNPFFKKLTNNQAAAQAIQLAKDKALICDSSASSSSRSSSAKQFKPNSTNSSIQSQNNNNNARPSTSTKRSTSEDPDEKMDNDYNTYRVNNNNNNSDDSTDDNNDVVVSRSTSAASSSSTALAGTSSQRASALASKSNSTDLKNLDDALKDAVKYVTRMSESGANDEVTSKSSTVYLSENKILKTIKKCKESVKQQQTQMEVDTNTTTNSGLISNYAPLINLVQRVFQSYKSLSISFQFKKDKKIEISQTMPCIPPFNIDFTSVRRSYSLLFGMAAESVIEELEEAIDHAVYALCISIRMLMKKNDLTELEQNQMLHSLLVVNELPILEDPKYMDRSAKIFYSTMSELPVEASIKIVRLWSMWNGDELKIFLNRLQQYITVCAISKNLDEESNSQRNQNNNNEDDDDETNENEQNCLHKSEGISGAVGILRLIYYASILGGRLDSRDKLKQEREIEQEDLKYLQTSFSLEENNLVNDTLNAINSRMDPLEKALDIRPIDCREPKISYDLFINEVVNKFIDIQHDYVEYIQQLQYLENNNHHHQHPHQAGPNSKKHIFSFLSHPFFLVLAKKNLGLYYDNKIKMMRERRHNIVMSIIEGSMPMPYFKIRLQRSNLLVEALSLIELQDQENSAILRKQLFVEFENEQGIDQGGVSKEFFQLAIDELLNKGYTFFTFDETTNYHWFTPCTLESVQEFKLIGMLFGIAIYNNVLLDVQFPPVFFRKLMGKLGTFEDLYYSHPQLHQSLKSLLEFEGSDEEFEDTFAQNFQISLTDSFENTVSFNLKENGDNIPVTKHNRKEFVELYSDFMLNKGIEEPFTAFKRGFIKITFNSPLSKWYSPEELEILLCGSKVLDWKSLENATIYDSGFEADHEYMKQFWRIFDDFTEEEKKLFLKFTTGTDRCPHGGLSELRLTIARNGPDTEKLPTAHTCFNVLLLPEYSSKQKLKEKLLKAIQYSRGFGLS